MEPDFSGFRPLPLIDCHVHHRDASVIPDMVSLMDSIGMEAINAVSTPHPEHLSAVPQGLEFKARHPQRVYVFGSLDYHELMTQGRLRSDLAAQIAVLQEVGCDGIKMIEGKPMARQLLGLPPFDGREYQTYFAEMEATGFPLLFHVADPDRFWDREAMASGARARGRFYGDDPALPTKEQLYMEVGHVLERHPNLKVIFAHFYFLSADLPRVAALLDAYPNVHLDISPGSGMYVNFSKDWEAAREFFLTYQDRIIFGTDTGTSALRGERGRTRQGELEKYWYMRTFLETTGAFQTPPAFRQGPTTLYGIGLPEDALKRIYHDNFRRLVGEKPALINGPAAQEECERLAAIVEGMGRSACEIRRIARVLAESLTLSPLHSG